MLICIFFEIFCDRRVLDIIFELCCGNFYVYIVEIGKMKNY